MMSNHTNEKMIDIRNHGFRKMSKGFCIIGLMPITPGPLYLNFRFSQNLRSRNCALKELYIPVLNRMEMIIPRKAIVILKNLSSILSQEKVNAIKSKPLKAESQPIL